ncbi:hypothetical protein [uncultured Nostoc sp.]|uniref:hypothetical protein n=1 Tax=uncultured Nostoc sp. TaxID=340711 RepID=UPI0035C9FC6E
MLSTEYNPIVKTRGLKQGNYQEELNSENNLIDVPSYSEYWVTIPSNYGSIWTVTTNT